MDVRNLENLCIKVTGLGIGGRGRNSLIKENGFYILKA
jgi:hypothetical protein